MKCICLWVHEERVLCLRHGSFSSRIRRRCAKRVQHTFFFFHIDVFEFLRIDFFPRVRFFSETPRLFLVVYQNTVRGVFACWSIDVL